MPKFDYVRPGSLEEAILLVNDDKFTSKFLAGGTDVMVYLHHECPDFDRVIDISQMQDLKIIQKNDSHVTLGAGVTFTEAIKSDILNDEAPVLVAACKSVGSPQIRNAGTIGGNIVNAAACADSLPALVALDARAHLRGKDGQRNLLVADFVKGPNRTEIKSGELLTHFTFPVPVKNTRSAFIKLGRRNAQAISRLTVAALGKLDPQGKVEFARIAPGAATSRTRRFTEVEEMLLGKMITEELIESASQKTAEVMIEITGRRWSTEYKEPALAALTRKALSNVFLTNN